MIEPLNTFLEGSTFIFILWVLKKIYCIESKVMLNTRLIHLFHNECIEKNGVVKKDEK